MTTDLDLIKSEYPSQYAGIIQDGRISTPLDVWGGKTFLGSTFNVLNLPAASAMCPLTTAQWALLMIPSHSGMMNLFVDGTTLKYPDRFYCCGSTPCVVYDMWGYSSIDGFPDETSLYAITASEYKDRQTNFREQYYDTTTKTLKDYTAPAPVPTITSRLADLEALCHEHTNAGIYFTPSAYTTAFLFDTGAASQSKMLTSFVAASNGLWPTTAVWKIDDGSFVNMTATDVIDLAKKSQAYIQACYATESDLQTKLQADLTTDITVGWPSNK